MNEKHKLDQSHAYDVVLRRFDCIRNQLMNEQAVVFRFYMRTRKGAAHDEKKFCRKSRVFDSEYCSETKLNFLKQQRKNR